MKHLLFSLIILSSFSLHAEYLKSSKCVAYSGFAYCAKSSQGHAYLSMGKPICSKGECIINPSSNKYICSKQDGGGAVIVNSKPKCQGECEEASIDHCEKLDDTVKSDQ